MSSAGFVLPALPVSARGAGGVLHHVRLWVLVVRLTVSERVASLRKASHRIESEHVIMIVGYGSMTMIHSTTLMVVAYTVVAGIHFRHVIK